MGGLVLGVANYRNAQSSIGYSFRYYSTKMRATDGIHLLAISGVEPTVEHIRDGSYPFTTDIYMVTATSPDRHVPENAQKLMHWFLSEQGQQLIEDVGYVKLSNK